MEDGERAVRILAHFHPRFHIVTTQGVFRQLQDEPAPGHRVVAGDDPVLFHAQDLGQQRRVDAPKALSATSGGFAKRALCAGT
ncbi:hypothetical protein A9K71_21435 [Mesorhizobium sp. WSM3873]|nr:hypothetical protein A9K71_21435 [Mesorhizobium sp. WSM3873]